jgi:hypothetical protein
VLWPEPIESTWQGLASGSSISLAKKMPHLSLADVLFIGAAECVKNCETP